MADSNPPGSLFPYLHGFNADEQDRLYRQAELLEQSVYRDVDFSECKHILEVGCGVGAQSAILLRRFPHLRLTGIDMSDAQLGAARSFLATKPEFAGRYQAEKMNAEQMSFEGKSFDGAFLCWILEHVKDPKRVLNEVRRVLQPGSKVYVTEVMNFTFFLDPYSPNVWKYWMAFNDYQYDGAGDPFIGAKLGNLLTGLGFKNVQTNVKTWCLDNRQPEKRRQMLASWHELMMSAADSLIEAKYTTREVVDAASRELTSVLADPNAVFYDSYMQAIAEV